MRSAEGEDMATTQTPASDLWWPTLNAPGLPAVHCVGHAGAWPGAFRALARCLDGRATVRALRLPGRDRRLAEPPSDDPDGTVATAAAALPPEDGPALVVGVCTGAYLAWRLAARWEQVRPRPAGRRALVAVGAGAPDGSHRLRALSTLDGDAIRRRLARSGATAPELLDDEEFRDVIVAAYRADIALAAAALPPARLRQPILAVSGEHDDLTADEVAGWRRLTAATVSWHAIPGAAHWVVTERPDRLADRLCRWLTGPP